jgi:hypothetical protein
MYKDSFIKDECPLPEDQNEETGVAPDDDDNAGILLPLLNLYKSFALETSAHGFKWTVGCKGYHMVTLW